MKQKGDITMKTLLRSLRIYVIFTVLLGLVYPVAITLIAQLAFPFQANGSLLRKGGAVVGSRLVGQGFTDAKYFQSRMSANNYDGTNSGGTNLGPSSKKLMDATADKIAKLRQENTLAAQTTIPPDMALTSASGLDPHISIENANIQAGRVAQARGMSLKEIKKLIDHNTDSDFIGIWGCQGVNVLALNMALDDMASKSK
jgi:K+-transporting ATPase ATPase C chain